MLNSSLHHLKRLRIHQRFTTLELINLIICNRIIKRKFVVDNAFAIYRAACIFPGTYITNRLLAATIGKMFTVGASLDSLKHNSKYFSNQSKLKSI